MQNGFRNHQHEYSPANWYVLAKTTRTPEFLDFSQFLGLLILVVNTHFGYLFWPIQSDLTPRERPVVSRISLSALQSPTSSILGTTFKIYLEYDLGLPLGPTKPGSFLILILAPNGSSKDPAFQGLEDQGLPLIMKRPPPLIKGRPLFYE